MAELKRIDDARVMLEGHVNKDTVPTLVEAGWKTLSAADTAQVVDLSGVSSADSSSLALLLEWTRRAEAASKPVSFEHFPDDMAALASVCGISELFPALS
ncbi:STAS domain-containing protein [Parendozoicomonas haliclonae]|uniref:STAS domain-containing protein n=1 Tax=Parendozoicomonas haliclonae TaxID=1960125 RepID=A0A1X7AFP1_9GAMM|nr:STAS domain-containing protein [Parendozoicomonas haliclonae]SMA37193.1 hypothetical protein EHSB41UT_00701 [Parendozoicomonas haliclonae]